MAMVKTRITVAEGYAMVIFRMVFAVSVSCVASTLYSAATHPQKLVDPMSAIADVFIKGLTHHYKKHAPHDNTPWRVTVDLVEWAGHTQQTRPAYIFYVRAKNCFCCAEIHIAQHINKETERPERVMRVDELDESKEGPHLRHGPFLRTLFDIAANEKCDLVTIAKNSVIYGEWDAELKKLFIFDKKNEKWIRHVTAPYKNRKAHSTGTIHKNKTPDKTLARSHSILTLVRDNKGKTLAKEQLSPPASPRSP
jgi:hypothetical protein